MASIHLEVATPAGLVIDEQVDEVVAPGLLGEFGARPGHQPYLVELDAGPLRYIQGGKASWFALSGGTAEVRADRVVVLADACEPGRDLDVDRAKDAAGRAEQRVKDFAKNAEIDVDRAFAALARARARLTAADKAR